MIQLKTLSTTLKAAIRQHKKVSCVVFAPTDTTYFSQHFMRMIEHNTYSIFAPSNKKLMNYEEAHMWFDLCDDSYDEKYYGMFIDHVQILTFLNKYRKHLSVYEQEVVDYLIENKIIRKHGKYYRAIHKFGFLILNIKNKSPFKTKNQAKDILRHEFCHLLYEYDRNFKIAANRFFKATPLEYKKKVKHFFNIKMWAFSPEEFICCRIGEGKFSFIDRYLNRKNIKLLNDAIQLFNEYFSCLK